MSHFGLKNRVSARDERGFAHLRLFMVLIALMAMVDLGVSAAARLMGGENSFENIYPTILPFDHMTVGLKPMGPQPPRPAIERLMDAARRMAGRTNVPYVFGGSRLGSANQCHECSECVRKNHLPANSTLIRYNKCTACRRCGIDCSNFVNNVFDEAGLNYRFADTRTLNGVGDGFLHEQYGFVNIGRDLWSARPGDLILEKSHIIMVIDIDTNQGTIDYIHASRGSKRTPVGGIELRRGTDIVKLQKSVVRILRHRELLLPDEPSVFVGSSKSVWADLRRLLAMNN